MPSHAHAVVEVIHTMSAWPAPRGESLILSLAVAALLAACGPGAPPPSPAAPPPTEVAVVAATAAPVGLVAELPGRTEASRIAQVRARVAGIVQR